MSTQNAWRMIFTSLRWMLGRCNIRAEDVQVRFLFANRRDMYEFERAIKEQTPAYHELIARHAPEAVDDIAFECRTSERIGYYGQKQDTEQAVIYARAAVERAEKLLRAKKPLGVTWRDQVNELIFHADRLANIIDQPKGRLPNEVVAETVRPRRTGR